ncbi:MAG: adenylate/guanylate cyclase domain-containing protein [Bdellovibrionota bacterium]
MTPFSWGEALERFVAYRTLFSLRDTLGKSPPLDPRIKVFAFDDAAVAEVDDRDLPLSSWLSIYQAIAKSEPATILIDRYWSNPAGLKDAPLFRDEIKKSVIPFIAGAHVWPHAISGRKKLPLSHKSFDAVSMFKGKKLDFIAQQAIEQQSDDSTAGVLYGPHHAIADPLQIGLLSYENDFYVKLFHFLAPDRVIAHLSLLAAGMQNIEVEKGALKVSGAVVPTDSLGRVLVNIAPQKRYSSKVYSLKGVIKRVQKGKGLGSVVKKGDVVILLPSYYTGHVDMVSTPLGAMPGGILMTAMVNSVLSGKWLRSVGGDIPLIFLFSLLGVGLTLYLRTVWLSITQILVLCTFFAVANISFSYFSIVIPWFFPSMAFVFTSAALFVERIRRHEQQSQKISDALTGFLSPKHLKQFLKRPSSLQVAPVGRNVTVMFIDITGYSLVSERLEPKKAFSQLRELLSQIREIIFAYGGVVDRTLGDGMLCFFGYYYDGSKSIENHATQAMDCAIEIQRTVVARNIKASEAGKLVYPLRIGINTSYVYIGNLGGKDHFDLTLIGDGVNYAQRLETACESNCIMLGQATYNSLYQIYARGYAITKRQIQIKHHDGFMTAYEVDPFAENPEQRRLAIAAYRDFAKIDRVTARYDIPENITIALESAICGGKLFNFSLGGFCAVMPEYIGKGSTLSIVVGDPNDPLHHELKKLGLSPLVCELRWGRRFGGNFMHGFMVKNLSESQKKCFVETLEKHVQQLVLKSRKKGA